MLLVLALAAAGCGAPPPCDRHGRNRTEQLVAQLDGRCLGFHSEPTDARPDDTCKRISTAGRARLWTSGTHDHVKWAAECLAEMGPTGRAAVPALVRALEHGPSNLDTGDGVIPTRDAIVRALGRVGDHRAVAPLVHALQHPRPVDVGPGAVGYASADPRGEDVALEALGELGPVARDALPDVLSHLAAPIDGAAAARRYRAAARAAVRIGEADGIAAVADGLDDPAKAVDAGRALGELGEAGRAHLRRLVHAVRAAPDGEGNAVLRQAVREVGGLEAFRALPPNYDQMMAELMRRGSRRAKAAGCERGPVHLDGPAEELRQELGTSQVIVTGFDRRTWTAERRVSGRLTLRRGDRDTGAQPFESLEQWETELASILARACP